MSKWFWEMLTQLRILTVDASSFQMAETLINNIKKREEVVNIFQAEIRNAFE